VVLGRRLVFARDHRTIPAPTRTSVVRSVIRSPSPGGTTP
jgi:hypothetical protein